MDISPQERAFIAHQTNAKSTAVSDKKKAAKAASLVILGFLAGVAATSWLFHLTA
jgi:hypothetical protein